MSVPYASATTGIKAREEIRKVLRCFGCEEIGFSENFEKTLSHSLAARARAE
jgi:hypothetical protein